MYMYVKYAFSFMFNVQSLDEYKLITTIMITIRMPEIYMYIEIALATINTYVCVHIHVGV